jgi:enoyl-CoA hydratase/carnithine racemase
MSDDLLVDRQGPVLALTLNRPAKLNAVTQSMYRELRASLMEAEEDPAIEVVTLTGAGRAFSAGGDLGDLNAVHASARHGELGEHAWNSSATFAQMESMAKPIVAKVNGLAHAGGFVLALCSDIVIAADTATFRLPEVLRGLVDVFASSHLPLSIGLPRAKYLALTGLQLTAAEAVEWGLIARAVPPADLEAVTSEVVTALLSTSPKAREWVKLLMNKVLTAPDVRGLRSTLVDAAVHERTTDWGRRNPESPRGGQHGD